MDRRNFVKTSISLAALTGLNPKLGATETSSPLSAKTPDLIAVRGGSLTQMYHAAINALGGLTRFVKANMKVLIKPNIGWAKTPEEGANTSPELVKLIIQECLKAGAAEVNVFDHTCNHWKDCYSLSGIGNAVETAKGKLLPGNSENTYEPIAIPKAKILKQTKVHKAYLESDLIINIPILKHHGGARMTSAMKNLMGVVWDRGFYHRNGLHQCIADFTASQKIPNLNIIDAYNVMMRNGPRGRSTDDLSNKKVLLMSTNIVAIDTAAARIMGLSPAEVAYLGKAEQLGVGTTDFNKLNIKKIAIKQ